MLRQAEDGRALRLAVAADALKYAGAVVDDVAHHVDGGLFPGNEIAVVPDFRGRLDGHGERELLRFALARIYLTAYRDPGIAVTDWTPRGTTAVTVL